MSTLIPEYTVLFGMRLAAFFFVLRRRNYPFNRSYCENPRSLDHLSSFSVISMLCTTTVLTSRSSTEMSSRSQGSSGHPVLGNDRKLGLVIQRCSLDNLCPFKVMRHHLDCGYSHRIDKQVEKFLHISFVLQHGCTVWPAEFTFHRLSQLPSDHVSHSNGNGGCNELKTRSGRCFDRSYTSFFHEKSTMDIANLGARYLW